MCCVPATYEAHYAVSVQAPFLFFEQLSARDESVSGGVSDRQVQTNQSRPQRTGAVSGCLAPKLDYGSWVITSL